MEHFYPNFPLVCSSESFICPFSLVTGKKYSVDTDLGQWKGTINGTFSRYEKNKIMFKEKYVWSIVFMDWWGDGVGYTQETPCQIQLYLDPIDDLKFYEI